MTSNEVARATGLSIDTIRRLEKRGEIKSQRDVNGWRVFDPSVVDEIKKLYAMPSETKSILDYLPDKQILSGDDWRHAHREATKSPLMRELDEATKDLQEHLDALARRTTPEEFAELTKLLAELRAVLMPDHGRVDPIKLVAVLRQWMTVGWHRELASVVPQAATETQDRRVTEGAASEAVTTPKATNAEGDV